MRRAQKQKLFKRKNHGRCIEENWIEITCDSQLSSEMDEVKDSGADENLENHLKNGFNSVIQRRSFSIRIFFTLFYNIFSACFASHPKKMQNRS